MVDRDQLSGSLVAGIFGIAWAQWAAADLPPAPGGIVRLLGLVGGVIVIVRSSQRRREAPAQSGSMFGARAYRLVLIGEAVALLIGALALGLVGAGEYIPCWFAAVVGVHFLVFGRLFRPSFYVLGAALLVAAVVGLAVGLGRGNSAAIEAVTGILAAVSLLGSGLWGTMGGRIGSGQEREGSSSLGG